MSANLPRPSVTENVSVTLATGISDVASSMDVSDASSIVSVCYLVIDRVDSSGTLKNTSFWEYVKVTNVSSNTLTITRGQNGSTAQAHSSGAIVEAVVTSAMFEDWYTALNPEHTATGGHVISTGTITNANISDLISVTNSLSSATVSTSLNVSAASVIGLGLNPTWFIPSLPSLPSVGLGRPMAMPRGGTLNFVNVTLNANVSNATTFFNVYKNSVSIFDTIGRPLIAGGTFVSTASIKTPTYNQGDVFRVDYENILGGNNVDATVTLASK